MNPLAGFGMGQVPQNPMIRMLQQFQQFRQTFQGNPQQAVQSLLDSGRMSRAQYDQYKAQAEQMAGQWMQFFHFR